MFFKVEALEQMVFYLVPNSDLWVYVLRPEDVFFMHYDFWPNPMPFIFRHDRHTRTQDVLIKKELGFEKSKSCNSESVYTGTYFISQCSKSRFVIIYVISMKLILNIVDLN